jgi:hypothetical protein
MIITVLSKKARCPNAGARPRRLDPVEVSEWIYPHPSFRMRDVYECHPKEDPPMLLFCFREMRRN